MTYLILFLINFIILAKTLKCGFVVDDDARIVAMSKIKKKKFAGMPWHHRIFEVTYGAGLFRNTFEDHLFTIMLQGINALLIYHLTHSFLASLLWVCNPVNSQISIWLNGRRYAMSIFFLLIAINFKILFVPFYAAAVWMHVLAVPGIIFLLTVPYVFFMPAAALAFKMFGWQKARNRFLRRKQDFTKINELHRLTWKKIIIFVKSLGYNFLHILIPTPRMYHQHLYYFGRYPEANKKGYSLNIQFTIGILVLMFMLYEIFFQHNIWAAWFLVFMAPWCGIVTVTQNAADRYCSLPAVGLMMILVKYISFLPYTYQIIAYSVLITIYLMKYKRLYRAYHSIADFYEYHLEIQPDCVESRTLYAMKIMQKEPFKAFALIKDGLRYRPDDFKLMLCLSQCFFALHRPQDALKVLDVAQQHCPLGEEEDCKTEFDKIRSGILRPVQGLNRAEKRRIKKCKK